MTGNILQGVGVYQEPFRIEYQEPDIARRDKCLYYAEKLFRITTLVGSVLFALFHILSEHVVVDEKEFCLINKGFLLTRVTFVVGLAYVLSVKVREYPASNDPTLCFNVIKLKKSEEKKLLKSAVSLQLAFKCKYVDVLNHIITWLVVDANACPAVVLAINNAVVKLRSKVLTNC